MPEATDLPSARRSRLSSARLYLICDCRPAGRDLESLLRAAIAGGVDVVQLRDKRAPADELARTAAHTSALCHELGALFIVNDDPRAALAADGDGVHVGQDDMPVQDVRDIVGPELLVGLSTHSRAEVDRVAGSPVGGTRAVDYIGVGPVFATPTKPGRAAVGLELVEYAASSSELPFFAIGGIDERNAGEVLRAGARRIAVVRAIAQAQHPEELTRELRAQLEQVAVEHEHRAAAA